MSSSCKCDCQGESPSSAGSTPKPSRRYEVGDEVELTVRVEAVPVRPYGIYEVAVVGGEIPEGRCGYGMFETELDAGRLKPRPIKVGDRVTWGSRYHSYEVFGIRDGDACLVDERYLDTGAPGLRSGFRIEPLSQLEKVS